MSMGNRGLPRQPQFLEICMQHERMARAGLTCTETQRFGHWVPRSRAQPALGQCSLFSWKHTLHTMHTASSGIKPTGIAKQVSGSHSLKSAHTSPAAASLETLLCQRTSVELWICPKWSSSMNPLHGTSTSSFPRSPPGRATLMVGSSCGTRLCSLHRVWWVLRQGMADKTRGGGQAPPAPATAPCEEELPFLQGKRQLTVPSLKRALETH